MLQYDEQGKLIGLDMASLDQPVKLPQNNIPAETAPGASQGFSFADMPVAPEAEKENGILDYISDFGKGIYNGVVSTVQETGQFGYDVADLAFDFEDKAMPGYEFLDSIKADTKTIVGDVTEGITNFVSAFVGAGKFIKAARFMQGGGKAMMAGRGLVQGAAADFIAIDPLENRLSNLVESYPAFSNPISRALAAEPDDTRWEGRFKNAVEGLGLGVATEAALTTAVRGVRALRRGDAKALDEALKTLEAADKGTPQFSEVNAESFIELRSKSSRPEFLTPYTAEEMQGWKHFATDDGVAFTLTDKMDIIGVVNNSGVKGAGENAIIEAIVQGGKTLDCIGDHLKGYYERFGFVENKSNRIKWADQYAPKGWDYGKYGRPDIFYFDYPERLSRSAEDVRARIGKSGQESLSGGQDTGLRGSGVSSHTGNGQEIRDGVRQEIRGQISSTVPRLADGTDGARTGTKGLHVADPANLPGAKNFADKITAESTPEALGSKYYKAIKENSGTPLELRLNKQEVINPARFSFATDEGYRVHQTISEMTYKDTMLGREGSRSWDEIAGEGLSQLEDLGFNTTNVQETLAKLSGNREVMEQAAKDAFVLQDMMVSLTREYEMLGSALERGNLAGEAAAQYARKFQAIEDALVESHVVMRDHGTTVGRSLGVLRKISQATDIKVDVGSLQKRLQTHKFSENAGKPQTLVRYAAKSKAKGFMEYGTEMFINNILSSPITHTVNITSNGLKVAMTPLYRALGHLRHVEFSQLKEDAQMVSNLFSSLVPSAKYALKALKEDRTVLEGIQGLGWTEGLKSTHIEKAWSKDNVMHRYYQKQLKRGMAPEQIAENTPAHVQISANVAEALGKVINLPTRFLKMEDEFFKQLTYRSELKTNLTAEALEKMPRAKSGEIAEYITRREASFFDEVGGGLDSSLLQKARENTFTQDLTGKLGKSFQQLSNAHPITKMVIPFVRTPTNLLLEAQAHVPLVANFTKRYKDAVAQGGRAAREAEGKVMLGGILTASTAVMAYQGLITGSAPEDPKLRQALERTGWKPHSIKIGDSYYSFNRLDPLAVLVSATANLVEAAPHLNDGEYKEFASALLVSNIQLLADKSYMKSLGSLMDALSGDEREAASIIQNMATGMIPYSSLLGAIRNTTDDLQRDVRSVESRIMNRIPGFSEELPAKYDWLTGKPVSQTFGFISPVNEDTVARELAVLGGVIKAPGYKLNNVEITEAQHSRYCELIGTVQLGGKNLHQALNSVIRSPAYDLQRNRNADVDGGRSAQLHKIIDRYRQAAQKQFAREHLEFTREKADLKREQKARKISNGTTRLGVQEPHRHSEQERNLEQYKDFIK